MKCRICHDEKRVEIETLIAEGKTSAREIARRYGMDKGNVASHLNHMPDPQLRHGKREAALAEDVLREALEGSLEVFRAARREGKNSVMLDSAKAIVAQVEVLQRRVEAEREREEAARKTATTRGDLIKSILGVLPKIEPALVVGDPDLLPRVLDEVARSNPQALLDALAPRLAFLPDLRQGLRAKLFPS